MQSTDKDGNKIISLPVGNILITITPDGGGGSIISDLHERVSDEIDDDESYTAYNSAIDGVESMILAHAIAGVDVESTEYLEGIESAFDAIGNNF